MADFKEKWIKQACQKIKLLCPKDDEDSIREFLSEAFDRDYVDNKCTIYNNYEKEEVETSYYNLFNWIDESRSNCEPDDNLSIFSFKRLVLLVKLDNLSKTDKSESSSNFVVHIGLSLAAALIWFPCESLSTLRFSFHIRLNTRDAAPSNGISPSI